MNQLEIDELKTAGAEATFKEICQQPEVWQETIELYKKKQPAIVSFFEQIKESVNRKVRVVFTGAGTSQYVGDTIVPYLNKTGDRQSFHFESIGTTDIVASPEEYLFENEPTILVSFARSGNSPESVAAVAIANQIVKELYHITVTCAEDGALAKAAKDDEKNLLLLMPPRSNDKGFAMTSSFTCMALSALLLFDTASFEQKERYVQTVIGLGKEVIDREQEIQPIIDREFDRIVYLGSGSLTGLTREAQLKVLELTAGKIATIFDSSMGFRHGPKSFVDEKTLIFVFVNNNPYTRRYDLDILEELRSDDIAAGIVSITQTGKENDPGETFLYKNTELLPDGYLALADIVFAQTIALLVSLKIGNRPDTPSPTGTVNRVVKGVVIHEYES
ncbi:sugar isomerase, AgaS family [Enterococcus faecalis 13-SD-W-01]|nr:sugar isomerase, AgaS family [Enterococcus faecalis 13-SD-W-01]